LGFELATRRTYCSSYHVSRGKGTILYNVNKSNVWPMQADRPKLY